MSDMAVKEFIEEMGLIFEESGHTRMAGKIFGSLLVCDPPCQSAAELEESTGASKASISTITRHLVLSGYLERVGIPGKKTVYYRLSERHLIGMVKRRLEMGSRLQTLLLRGMTLINDTKSRQYKRLEELSDLYAFIDAELPLLIEKWRKKRNCTLPPE
jgi:hypothetical protein